MPNASQTERFQKLDLLQAMIEGLQAALNDGLLHPPVRIQEPDLQRFIVQQDARINAALTDSLRVLQVLRETPHAVVSGSDCTGSYGMSPRL